LTCTLTLAIVFSTGLARFGDRFHVSMAILFVMYALVTLWVAKNQGIAMRQQILLNLENQSLRAIAESERERAAAASEAKTTFLAATSHDLRQPLHALVQYCAHLHRANRDPELDDTVRRIGASLDAMRDLLDSILDLSQLMVGGVQPVVAVFPAASPLAKLDTQLRPLAAARGLRLDIESSHALIESDELLLERILRSLVLNSIRYTNQGRVMVRCRERRHTLEIQVWDTGVGIPGGELQQVFDPFYQVDNRARDRRKGLGLGLAIVRRLCDLLGHRIKVKTQVGKGTVFVVSVPLCADPSAMHESRQLTDSSAKDYVRGAFVVLVDDDPLSRDGSECTLKAFGCRTLAVASSAEAIEKLPQHEFPPQLILVDYRLETETGIEAIQRVTEDLHNLFGETLSVAALVVSGDAAPSELRPVSEQGYRMLHKPVAAEDLWTALNRLLESKALEAEP
jgi:signal transduction histidine kinase/CheY-like chemotaxis protein